MGGAFASLASWREIYPDSVHWRNCAPPLAKAEGCQEQVLKKMDVLVERLSFGTDLKGLELAKLRIRGLGRSYISGLAQNGPKALNELSIQELEMMYLLWVFYGVMDRETTSRDELVAAEPDQLYERPMMLPETWGAHVCSSYWRLGNGSQVRPLQL